MKSNFYYFLLIIIHGIFIYSCVDYLDVIPDNIPTVEHAFNNRYRAENALFGCFSYLPNHADFLEGNPAFYAGDEVWSTKQIDPVAWGIARGEQGTNSPLVNYWASKQANISLRGGKDIFTGLRDINIFLENINKPFDLENWEREQWIREVKFIKAYLHFWLFRMYGPIPLIKENIPISASSDKVQVYREPIDEVVNYIVSLLDEIKDELPEKILDISNDLGRPTKPMAYALKAQVLTYAASPLFNGNTDYAGMLDNRGIVLFPQEYKVEKWEKAVVALKEAIDQCHIAGHELFNFKKSFFSSTLNDSTIMAMNVRGAVVERLNSEIIWGDPNSNTNKLQEYCFPAFTGLHGGSTVINKCHAPTLRVIEQFYTKNGVPIEEDKDWMGIDPYELRKGDDEHSFYIKKDYTTINLHFNREARFYGAITFDGGTFYGNGSQSDDKILRHIVMLGGGPGFHYTWHSSTGYLVKKLVHYLSSVPDNDYAITKERYAFPVIRLADLYLMYAEALNELKEIPDAEVYEYIDKVRQRTGLKGVIESWYEYALDADKPKTKIGMREIIQRERLNELAFEGSRFWDLRRWKLAEQYMNQPIRGLNFLEDEVTEFYKPQEVFKLTFEKKDYFWPIAQRELLRDRNLIQNIGW